MTEQVLAELATHDASGALIRAVDHDVRPGVEDGVVVTLVVGLNTREERSGHWGNVARRAAARQPAAGSR